MAEYVKFGFVVNSGSNLDRFDIGSQYSRELSPDWYDLSSILNPLYAQNNKLTPPDPWQSTILI